MGVSNHRSRLIEGLAFSDTSRAETLKSDLRILALPLLLCVLLAACRSGLGDPSVLRDKPEATLAPPGAEFLGDGGENAAPGIEGPVDAEWGTSFSVDLDPMEIRDWYADELAAAGWLARQMNFSYSLPATSWCRDGQDYRLQLLFRERDFDPPTHYTLFVRPQNPERDCRAGELFPFGPEE